MSAKNDGGPAFPYEQHETQDGTWNQTTERGMSLRDYFAGQALVGLVSHKAHKLSKDYPDHIDAPPQDALDYDCALDAYALADAMLAAREV